LSELSTRKWSWKKNWLLWKIGNEKILHEVYFELNITCKISGFHGGDYEEASGMLHCVALVRTDVSEELSTSFIRVTRIGELGTTLAVTSNRRTLRSLLVTASVVPSSPILSP
jgi:hypothetical protein